MEVHSQQAKQRTTMACASVKLNIETKIHSLTLLNSVINFTCKKSKKSHYKNKCKGKTYLNVYEQI
ncbi:hypothetical protein LINPERPRIM_LOCUS23139 [Linum perenne]